jgi:hypothetical protein
MDQSLAIGRMSAILEEGLAGRAENPSLDMQFYYGNSIIIVEPRSTAFRYRRHG